MSALLPARVTVQYSSVRYSVSDMATYEDGIVVTNRKVLCIKHVTVTLIIQLSILSVCMTAEYRMVTVCMSNKIMQYEAHLIDENFIECNAFHCIVFPISKMN